MQIYLPCFLGILNYTVSTTVMQNKICGINNQNQPRLIQFLIYDHDPHEGKILLQIRAIYLKKLILLDCTPISFPPAVPIGI